MRARVFYSGTHTDNAGSTRVWTPDEVRAIGRKYNESSGRPAPVVKGHPKTDDPRWGQINRPVQIVENNPKPGQVALFAELGEIVPAFAEEVQAGQWTHCSAKLGSDGSLIHLGVLGAAAPALDECSLEFSLAPGEIAYTMEFAVGDTTTDTTATEGNTMTPDEIKAIADAVAAGVTTGLKPTLDEIGSKLDTVITGKAGGEEKPEEEKPEGETPAFNKAYFEKTLDMALAPIKKELEDSRKETATLKTQNLTAEFSAWMDTDEVKKRVPPAMRPGFLKGLIAAAGTEGTVEFSKDGKTEKGSAVDAYKATILSMPEFPLGTEFARIDNDPGKAKADEERTAYIKGLTEASKRA